MSIIIADGLKAVIMRRDNLTETEADEQIAEAREELNARLESGETPDDICQEFFGLEPDYIFDLMF